MCDFFFKVAETRRHQDYESMCRYVYTSVSESESESEFIVLSHVVSTVPRQAVECVARNPCIHDQTDIKSAEGMTEAFSVAPSAL